VRRCSPATSSHQIVPRAHWTPSPCGRLSRPPRWVVTPTTTTGPPPRPGGNSGRCACPRPKGPAGTAGALPTFTHQPVGRVGAQLYPGDIAALHRNTVRGLARPSENRTDKTALTENEDRASRQPIAASFGPVTSLEASTTGIGFPTPFCLASGPGPLAADRSYIVEGRLSPNAAPPASVLPSSFSRPLRRSGMGPHTPPGHMAPRGAIPLPSKSSTPAAGVWRGPVEPPG
jgi:hypothetical protein